MMIIVLLMMNVIVYLNQIAFGMFFRLCVRHVSIPEGKFVIYFVAKVEKKQIELIK